MATTRNAFEVTDEDLIPFELEAAFFGITGRTTSDSGTELFIIPRAS